MMAERSATTSSKRRLLTGSDEDEGTSAAGNNRSKAARLLGQEPRCSSEFLNPVKPRPGFAFPEEGSSARYVVYLAIKEPLEGDFSDGLKKCAKTVSRQVYRHCFQRDGTRHVTMYEGVLSHKQASQLSFLDDFEPVSVKFDAWMPWKAGCYLKLAEETVAKLQSLVDRISGLPAKGGKRPCNHLSLYRKRGYVDDGGGTPKIGQQFDNVRRITHDWGTIDGVSIRIKQFGTEYDECKVLAGI